MRGNSSTELNLRTGFLKSKEEIIGSVIMNGFIKNRFHF